MAIVGREAWVRQQERAQAMDTARSIPSSITSSRLLSLATQITAILHQLELSEEDDCCILEQIVTSPSSSFSSAITEALAVAMLLRSLSSKSTNDSLENKELGIWNTWKSSSSSSSSLSCPSRDTKVLAAIEKLGWEQWIPLLLPWLPDWHNTLGAELLLCSTSPHLSGFLIASLSQHVEYVLLGTQPEEAIPAMKGLDSYLLKSSLGFGGDGGEEEVRTTLIALEKVLDGWLSNRLKQQPLDNSSSGDSSSEEVFQTACQLRTRLALGGFSAPPPPSSSLELENANEESDTSFTESPEPIQIEEMKSVWRQILYLHDTTTTTDDGDCLPNRCAIGLAAHAAVSALFLQDNTLLTTHLNTSNTRDSIFSDPDPTSPAKMTLAALIMLEQAATASRSTPASILPTKDKEEIEKKKKSGFLVYPQCTLEILPSLIWAVSSFVENLHQKQRLIDLFLNSSDGIEPPQSNIVKLNTARVVMLESGSNSTTALVPFLQWAHKESIALSNLVRTDEVLSKITVLGQEQPGMDAAVHAVFPAALLCPDILMKVLLDGAAGQRGKAMLLVGILQYLPALKSVKKPSNSQLPILLELLKTRLQSSSTSSFDEDQRSALQDCVVTLCRSPSSASSLGPATHSSSSSSSVTPVVVVDPAALIKHAVLPALHHAAATSPVEGAQDLAMLFKLARWLLAPLEPLSSNRIVYSQLSLLSFKFLDFSSRRIDLNPLGLLLPREVIEEAYAVAHICSRSTSNTSNTSNASADYVSLVTQSPPQDCSGGGGSRGGGIIWERNDAICNHLAGYIAEACNNDTIITTPAPINVFKGFEPSQIRDALVIACAVMLPCCATDEASTLYTWLKEAVNYTLVTSEIASSTLSADKSSMLDGAVIEVLCRAVHAVAFVPGLIPIAGEDIPLSNTPSQLRCRAVGRLLQHLGLASQAAIDAAAGKASRVALIARIFKEISRCTASLNEYYDVSPLHVCLMQLIHVFKQEMAKTKLAEVAAEVKNTIALGAKLVNDPAITASVASLIE